MGGEPVVLRSTPGRHRVAAAGEVVAIASEHDPAAGTERGPNTIFAFDLGAEFVACFERVERIDSPSFDTDDLPRDHESPIAVVPSAP